MSTFSPGAKWFGRVARGMALAGCLGLGAQAVWIGPSLVAQQTQRVVQGKITDKSDAPLKGATVYLKDDHTLAVKSYIASDDGSYRFGQLAQSADYEVWAE